VIEPLVGIVTVITREEKTEDEISEYNITAINMNITIRVLFFISITDPPTFDNGLGYLFNIYMHVKSKQQTK
jgi:hypothetical protein